MDTFNFVKDGVIKLPPGFRFQPTDEEIVFQYLTRKIFSRPLPATIIPEVNIYKHDPWDLPAGESDEDRYFFSNKEAKYQNGNQTNRTTGGGYWKATGLDKQVINSKIKPVMGMRKTLVFYKGKPPHAARTDWIMHEFRLVHHGNATDDIAQSTKTSTRGNSLVQIGNWVFCHIFLKKRNMNTTEDHENIGTCKDDQAPRFYQFMMGNLNDLGPNPPTSSSSSNSDSSSVITEDSSSQLDNEETSCLEIQ
ncbi:unnamed protein product [Ilex paraguariensis]|uniref:NAC domain-containing protein n=1 Tax=Ilex paraguariensis TaxID=185542 RepID=A0ABC8V0S0_9AQUA